MLNYRDYLEQVIGRRDYVLADMEERIDRLWLDGKLTEQDRDELMQLAADNAKDSLQIDVAGKLAELEKRIFALEHPEPEFPIWVPGMVVNRGEPVRYDVTGDGLLDVCRYDGGRTYTAAAIGKIEGWHLLDSNLNLTHTITRDASGNFVLTPIEAALEAAAGDGE